MHRKVDFHKPDITKDEINEVVKTLKSGWITSGPKVKKFEDAFERIYPKGYKAIAVSSATAGLHLSLEALNIKKGDEVIVPTHTFTATAEVVEYLGAKPIFSDVDAQTLCIGVDNIKGLITKKTKAVIPVHFAGYPCDLDQLSELANKNSIDIVEDAAHAFPTKYKDRLIGSISNHLTVFSFYANKTITTGEGGMVVLNNEKVSKRIMQMRSHGIDRDVFDRFNSIKASWYYQVVAAGFKYNMTDISASLGIHQLRRSHIMLEKRQRIAKEYNKKLTYLPIQLPVNCEGNSQHSWHLYSIRLNKEINSYRDDLINYLTKCGIGTSVHYVPLHRHKYWSKKYALEAVDFPNSENAFKSCISLPIHSKMTLSDVDYVCHSIKQGLQEIL